MKSKLKIFLDKYKKVTDKKEKDLVRYQIEGEITMLLSSTIDSYSDHLKDIVLTVSTLMDSERVSLMVRKGNFLEISASYGLPENAIEKRSLVRIGTGIAGKVAQTGEPVFTGDLTRDDELRQSSIGGPGFKSNAFICLPLKHDNEVVGVINVSNPAHGTTYKISDFNFLKRVADRIATLLHKSMKFESMRVSSEILPYTLQTKTSGTHIGLKKAEDIKEGKAEGLKAPEGTWPPPLPPGIVKKQ